jgi:hypothetical protein
VAKGVSEAFARVRALLTTTSGVGRPLSTALVDWTDLCRGDRFATPEQVGDATRGAAFVLEIVGGEPRPDWISQPSGLRRKMLRLTLSVFAGLGEDRASDYGAVQQTLATLTDEVIQVLEDPINWNRTTTGIWNMFAFKDAEHKQINGRRHCELSWTIEYEQDYPAL